MRRLAVAVTALALGCGERAREPRPGLLDHQAHHGGIVAAGPRVVVEARAWPDGTVRVWLGDGWRRPLPLDGVHGTARLLVPGRPRDVPLAAEGDALVAHGEPLEGDGVPAMLDLVHAGGEVLHVPMVLPLRPGAPGAANVPLDGCVAPTAAAGMPAPRCVLTFLQGLATVAATPAGDTMVVAVLESPTSAWRLPEATLRAGFVAPAPEEIDAAEAPHAEEPTSIAVAPDGREAVLAVGEHLLRHDVATGALRATLHPGGPVRSVVWPRGDTLAATRFGGREVLVLSPTADAPTRTLPVDDETVTTVAASGDGRLLATGTESGAVLVLDAEGRVPARRLPGPPLPVDAVAVAGGRVVAAGGDGVLRIWDAATGTLEVAVETGVPLMRVAASRDGRRVATADREARIRLHAMPDGRVVHAIGWHRGQVRALAFAGDLLVAGDADRQLALWPIPAAGANRAGGAP